MVNQEKLANLMLYIAGQPRVKNLGLTKMYKLIYFTDAHHLREFGETITGSDYIKYDHGPVPSRGEKVLNRLEKLGVLEETRVVLSATHEMRQLRSLTEPNLSLFSKEEMQSVDFVCEHFGHLPAKTLSDMSHLEPAWACARKLDKLDPKLMVYGLEEDAVGL